MAAHLNRQTWIVTGASRGIGAELAKQAAALGANVVLAARDGAALEAVAGELAAGGGRALAVPTDITDPGACQGLVDAATAAYGGVDVLILNAGITMHAPFTEADPSVFRKLMEVNYFGALNCIRPAIAPLERSRGAICAVSSVAGLRGLPTRTGYSASKFALRGFCEALRVELKPRGIDVLVASPGMIETDIRERALGPDGEPGASKLPAAPPAMSAADCATQVVQTIRRRRRHRIITWGGKAMVAANRLAPGLMDRVLGTIYRREQNREDA